MLMRELLVSASRPRALLLKTLIPLVLTLPLLLGHAPVFWAAMLLTVLAAMTGAVGSAVTIARARESGLLTRLALTPRPAWRTAGSWVAGAVAVDSLQLAPSIVALLVLAPVSPMAAVAIVLSVIATLVVANVLGCVVSVLGGGPGEVLLDVVVVLAPLLFLGGLFTGVPPTGWRAVAALVDPFSYVHAAFITSLGGAASYDAVAVISAGLITIAASGMLLAVLARRVLERA